MLQQFLNISQKKFTDFKSFTSNGFSVFKTKVKKNKQIFVIATLKGSKNLIYRFILLTNDQELKDYEGKFVNILYTFSNIQDDELDKLTPPIIKIVTSSSQKNFKERLINNLNIQSKHSKQLFDTINDIQNEEIETERKFKIIY